MAKSSKTYTELKQELDDISIKLRSEDIDINKSIEYYEQGMKLINQINDYLDTAKNKIVELNNKYQ